MLVPTRVGHLKFINPAIFVNSPNEISDKARPPRAIQEGGDAGHVRRREVSVTVAERGIRRREPRRRETKEVGVRLMLLGPAIGDAGETALDFALGGVLFEPSLSHGIAPGRQVVAGPRPRHAGASAGATCSAGLQANAVVCGSGAFSRECRT